MEPFCGFLLSCNVHQGMMVAGYSNPTLYKTVVITMDTFSRNWLLVLKLYEKIGFVLCLPGVTLSLWVAVAVSRGSNTHNTNTSRASFLLLSAVCMCHVY